MIKNIADRFYFRESSFKFLTFPGIARSRFYIIFLCFNILEREINLIVFKNCFKNFFL